MEDSKPEVWAPGQNAALAPILPSEARALTRKIRKAGDHLWELLIEARDKQAWRAMGYASWDLWAEAEFAFTGRQAFREIGRGEVILALESALPALTRVSVSKTVQHRDVPVLKPDLPAVVEEVREAVQEGTEPAEAVRQSVAKRTTITPVRGDPGPPFKPIKTIDQIERPVVDAPEPVLLDEASDGPTIDPETGEILDAPPRADWQDRLTIPGAVEYLLLYSPSELNQQGPRDKIALLKHLLDLAIAEGNPRAARKLQRETVSVPPPDQSNGRARPEGSLTRREVTPNFKKASK